MSAPHASAAPAPFTRIEDPDRLAALLQTELLDSPCEAAFDRLTRLASRLVKAPVTLLSLIEARRQFFKSHVGLPEPLATRREIPLSHSFCRHVVASGEPLIIEDARTEPLAAQNPAVLEMGGIAYAGIPLTTPEGHTLGTFCVIDDHPRRWTDEEIEILSELAASALTEIELRLAQRAAERAQQELQAAYTREKRIATSLQECMLVLPPESGFPGLDVEVLYQPVSDEAEIGGDFFDVFELEGGWIALAVGDATGKGLAAGVRAAEAKYALRAYLHADKEADLAGTLSRLNRFLCEVRFPDRGSSGSLIALSLAVVHPSTGEVRLARAGADPPLLLGAQGSCRELAPEGLLLGVSAGGAFARNEFEVLTCHLAPGDTLLLFTDGLTEARRGRGGELLGYEGAKELACRAAASVSPSSPLRHLGDAIVEGARDFARGVLTDDLCLLLARRG
jgi:sigma-B regulation protein RsbU (phosphoserine phosphatase)